MRLRNLSKIIVFALVMYGLATAAPSHAVQFDMNFTINLGISDGPTSPLIPVGSLTGMFSGDNDNPADTMLHHGELDTFMVNWSGPVPAPFGHDLANVFTTLPDFNYDINTNTITSFTSIQGTPFSSIVFSIPGFSYINETPYQYIDQIVTPKPHVPQTPQVPLPNPEPGTYLLFGTGLIGIVGYGMRQRRRLSVAPPAVS